MASSWIHNASGAAVAAAATEFFPLVGHGFGQTTEALAQILVRDTYTGSNLYTIVSANTNDGTTTIRTRKNASDGAQSVSYAASETGAKEDTVNTDAMATGENWDYSVNPAGTMNTCTVANLSVVLQHSGTGTFIMASSAGTTLAQAQNVLNYASLTGSLETNATEANAQYTLRTDGTLRNLRVYVSANSIAAGTVARTRVNGGNGAQSVSITASTTGSFEDVTNSDTVTGANAGEWNCLIDSTSAKNGTLTTTTIQCECSSIRCPQIWSRVGGLTVVVDTYQRFEGGQTGSTVESNMNLKARVALAISNMFTYVSANTTTVCNVYFRKNGANAGPTVNYGSGVTGIKEDTVNTTTVAATDLINYFTDLTSGASITFTIIGVESQQGASGITVTASGAGALSLAAAAPGLRVQTEIAGIV